MLIKVKAFPCSEEQAVIKKTEDSFEVKVEAEPKRGLANREIIEALSLYFKIPQSAVRLIKGFRERNKIFEIKN
jgi:hypothetical protein